VREKSEGKKRGKKNNGKRGRDWLLLADMTWCDLCECAVNDRRIWNKRGRGATPTNLEIADSVLHICKPGRSRIHIHIRCTLHPTDRHRPTFTSHDVCSAACVQRRIRRRHFRNHAWGGGVVAMETHVFDSYPDIMHWRDTSRIMPIASTPTGAFAFAILIGRSRYERMYLDCFNSIWFDWRSIASSFLAALGWRVRLALDWKGTQSTNPIAMIY
jgi:hypothetical protein